MQTYKTAMNVLSEVNTESSFDLNKLLNNKIKIYYQD